MCDNYRANDDVWFTLFGWVNSAGHWSCRCYSLVLITARIRKRRRRNKSSSNYRNVFKCDVVAVVYDRRADGVHGLLVRSTRPGPNLRQMPTRPRFTPQIQTAGQSNLSVYVVLIFHKHWKLLRSLIMEKWFLVDFYRFTASRKSLAYKSAAGYTELTILSLCFVFYFSTNIGRWRFRFLPWAQGFAWCVGKVISTPQPSALSIRTGRSITDFSRSRIFTGAITNREWIAPAASLVKVFPVNLFFNQIKLTV